MIDFGSMLGPLLDELVGSDELGAAGAEEKLADVGLDSITLIELAVRLESVMSTPISDDMIAELRDTPLGELGDLVRHWLGGSRPITRQNVAVRGYQETDRLALAKICRETCTDSWRCELAHLLWLYQYVDQEPQACFVAESDGAAIGYWIGSSRERNLAEGFGRHVWRYRSEFIHAYMKMARRGLQCREHVWFWSTMVGAVVHPVWAFRRYNRREELGPILGMTRAHFQVAPESDTFGVVYHLGRSWLRYLASRGIDLTCLPGVPGGSADDANVVAYWHRVGYVPVRYGNWSILVAFVGPDWSSR